MEVGSTAKSMVKELINTLMDQSIRVIGKMTNKTEEESSISPITIDMKVILRMVNVLAEGSTSM